MYSENLAFVHATVISPHRIIEDGTVLVKQGIITDVGPYESILVPDSCSIKDCTGKYLVPGFIDIHVNGGGGAEALDGTDEAIEVMCRTHARGGTTACIPTIITAPLERMIAAVKTINRVKHAGTQGAQVLGAYIEGPFLSEAYKGAHTQQHLLMPEKTSWKPFLENSEAIAIFGLAPELPGSIPLIRELKQHGILPAIAHSEATYDEVMHAADAGATHITHLFCAMSQMFRKPGSYVKHGGVTEAALLCDDLTVEIIGDGHHVPGELIRLTLKNKPEGTVCTVTDAMRAAGMGPGGSTLGDKDIIVEDGIALLLDRSQFAGSIATMDMCIRNMVTFGEITLQQAVRTATLDPATLLGISDRKGSITAGKDADLVILNNMFTVESTMVSGRIVYTALRNR